MPKYGDGEIWVLVKAIDKTLLFRSQKHTGSSVQTGQCWWQCGGMWKKRASLAGRRLKMHHDHEGRVNWQCIVAVVIRKPHRPAGQLTQQKKENCQAKTKPANEGGLLTDCG